MSATVAAPNDCRPVLRSALSEIVEMSRELFLGPISVEEFSDPESPGDTWTILNVESSGSSKELVRASCEWHERLARQFPDSVSSVKLSIYPIV